LSRIDTDYNLIAPQEGNFRFRLAAAFRKKVENERRLKRDLELMNQEQYRLKTDDHVIEEIKKHD